MNIIRKLQENKEIWDIFSRKEEYNPVIKDKLNRFSYAASKDRDIFEPRVSRFLTESGFTIEYPDRAEFAVCLSHDIDWIYKESWRKGLDSFRSLKSMNLSQSLQDILDLQSRKKPYCNVEQIVELEERYGASSTFYFLALKSQDMDFSYDVADLAGEFEFLHEHGAEIGLHGGHDAYNSMDALSEEKKRLEKVLGKKVLGYRNHFLKFIVPDTWENLCKAGFLHDSTFGYSDCVGFRNGMCHPFMPFNLTTNREIDILEIPLVIHDTTLFEGYMRLDPATAWTLAKDLINKTERNHGVITVLWHNKTFNEPARAQLYEKILDFCTTKKAWMTNAGEIASFWKNNGWKK